MSTRPLDSQRASPAASPDLGAGESAVVFRGDGEPISPQQLLHQLAEVEQTLGFKPDNYTLGGSVADLENRFAQMLGKEAAIFMPTGTLANHLAIRELCGGRRRALVQEQSHLYHDTGDGVTQLSGISLIPLAKDRPCFTLDEVEQAVNQSHGGRVDNPIGALMIESPVRRQLGQVVPFSEMRAITAYCQEQDIGTHLDGARLYMMSAASGVAPEEYSALFDLVYVSLYKYFGAPFGAILAGGSARIEGMFHARRMFGGGLAHSYPVAALALRGTEGFAERFQQAMSQGRELLPRLSSLPGLTVREFEHGSNIFPLSFADNVDQGKVAAGLRQRDIFIYPSEGSDRISSLTVNTTILRQSNDTIFEAFGTDLTNSR